MAVLVTSNSVFAKAAYEYGQRHEETLEVSSVITDFSLANMAWLKAPFGASSLPISEFLAYASAAHQPSRELLDKFVMEADKLEKNGTITYRDYQLLRSTVLAQDELMNLTLGEDEALTSETILLTLERVINEIKKEERTAHDKTRKHLILSDSEKRKLKDRLYWKCERKAKIWAWTFSGLLSVILIVGIFMGLDFVPSIPLWASCVIIFCASLMAVVDLFIGVTIKGMYKSIKDKMLKIFLKRESEKTNVKFEVKE